METINELTDQLAAIRANINKEDKVVILLASLPSSYIKQELLGKEQKRIAGLSYDVSSQDRKMDSRTVTWKSIWCYGCHDLGRIKKNCPNKQGEKQPQHKAKIVGEIGSRRKLELVHNYPCGPITTAIICGYK